MSSTTNSLDMVIIGSDYANIFDSETLSDSLIASPIIALEKFTIAGNPALSGIRVVATENGLRLPSPQDKLPAKLSSSTGVLFVATDDHVHYNNFLDLMEKHRGCIFLIVRNTCKKDKWVELTKRDPRIYSVFDLATSKEARNFVSEARKTVHMVEKMRDAQIGSF